jgi:hypothetical protein
MSRQIGNTYFARGTCNTIDDVTGLVVKLDQTFTRWDSVQCTKENYEERQPQDFPPFPKPQKTYVIARSDIEEPAPTAYNPANGWSALS